MASVFQDLLSVAILGFVSLVMYMRVTGKSFKDVVAELKGIGRDS